MIDIKGYFDKKTRGLCVLVKAGDAYALSTKKFNSETGEDLSDEVVGVNLQELLDKKDSLKSEIADIDTFIADTKAL